MKKLSVRSNAATERSLGLKKFVSYANTYDKEENPGGFIALGIAENHLMDKECLEAFRKAANDTFGESDMGYGDGISGSSRLAKAMSDYFNDYFSPLEYTRPDQIVFANGCTALFDQLGQTLCDEGETILIPAPYYNAYQWDFTRRTKAVITSAAVGNMDEGFEPVCIEAYRQTMADLKEKGIKATAMVVTNPHNPLGRTYPRETLLALAKFAEEEDLHLIMNEIYARSVYVNDEWPEAPVFESSLSIDFAKELEGGFDRSRLHRESHAFQATTLGWIAEERGRLWNE